MRPYHALLAVVALLAFAGCNGPKETCQGSFESYYSMLEKHDWEGIYEILTPEFKRKLTAVRVANGMEEQWKGSKSFSITPRNMSETGPVCFVSGSISYTIRIKGKEPERIDDEYFSWTLRKQQDGRWYMELPGMEKVSAF